MKTIKQELAVVKKENLRLKLWVQDMQNGGYVNCVYCGYRYGPVESTPVSLSDVLKAHVQKCPLHPMAALKKENIALKKELTRLRKEKK